MDGASDIKHAKYHSAQTEQSKRHLAPIAAKLPAISHAFIFYEMKLEPVAQHIDVLINVIMCFDIKLQRLVCQHNKEYNECDVFAFHNGRKDSGFGVFKAGGVRHRAKVVLRPKFGA